MKGKAGKEGSFWMWICASLVPLPWPAILSNTLSSLHEYLLQDGA